MTATSPPETTRSTNIRVGRHWVALADVSTCHVQAYRERDRRGSVATVLVGMVAAMIFAIGVIEHGWRTRFWLGATVCALIALSAVQDVFKATPIVLYRFDIHLKSGKRIAYTTTDAAETARLQGLLRWSIQEGL